MVSIDFGYYGENIATYSNDDEFMQLRNVEEMCLIMKNAHLSISEFNDVFGRFKSHFTPKELFEILHNTSINIDSISDSLILINSLSSILDTRIFSDIGNSIRSYINTAEKALSESKLLSSLKKCSNYDSLDNLNQIYHIMSAAAQERDNETIKYAIQNGYADVKGDIILSNTEIISNAESNYSFLQSNVLIKAALEGELELVKSLEEKGANMGYRTSHGETFPHAFCINGNVEGVKFALNFIDVNDVNNSNETPLYCSIWAYQLNAIQYLLVNHSSCIEKLKSADGTIIDEFFRRSVDIHELSRSLVGIALKSPKFNIGKYVKPFMDYMSKKINE
ncbi:hypothetical protein TVAG_088110 [Trichomonas vaginalis G3]|uniref:Uncharacterized protein n=1 Tax=Trichomonas vaginalis (strain ATCC PRA-98 / G3) TaxID=412133 RepID=A2F5K3_TRIV3|nr:RelA-associated inhibitor family [Trichomonas vaginalis G3]EAX99829.1 hypothetical protein TVAG_088110 [Trichomonas vaginalis G3]KAI5517804.1 RelA-associated inhibitor family [Trichomonas vaginalis G3]|eukprot:XP_001312759.1 hypothetical protein [Trichomonas vaginalis G3]